MVVMVRVHRMRVEEPTLDGREWDRAYDQFPIGGLAVRRGDHLGKLRNSLIEEDIFGGYYESSFAGAKNELDAQNGVAAELKEIAFHADRFHAQDLGPD